MNFSTIKLHTLSCYKNKKTIRIMVGRPNYNSRNLESASIIISVSILLDAEKNEGPPRYFSVASGQEDVKVRDIFVTNLDRVGVNNINKT